MTCLCLRIQPLSGALRDLYKDFSALKEHLAELTAKVDRMETFVDDVREGRRPTPLRGKPRPLGSPPGGEAEARDAGPRLPGRRIVVRRIKKPAASQD